MRESAAQPVLVKTGMDGPGVDEPIVVYEGTGTTNKSWMMADHQGSIIGYTNIAGAVTDKNTYSMEGVPGDNNVGRFGYTGQMWLEGAELYHYKARAYDPHLGRFLQPDPIGYGDGLNMYAYVGGDAMNSRDPSGLARYTCTVTQIWQEGHGWVDGSEEVSCRPNDSGFRQDSGTLYFNGPPGLGGGGNSSHNHEEYTPIPPTRVDCSPSQKAQRKEGALGNSFRSDGEFSFGLQAGLEGTGSIYLLTVGGGLVGDAGSVRLQSNNGGQRVFTQGSYAAAAVGFGPWTFGPFHSYERSSSVSVAHRNSQSFTESTGFNEFIGFSGKMAALIGYSGELGFDLAAYKAQTRRPCYLGQD